MSEHPGDAGFEARRIELAAARAGGLLDAGALIRRELADETASVGSELVERPRAELAQLGPESARVRVLPRALRIDQEARFVAGFAHARRDRLQGCAELGLLGLGELEPADELPELLRRGAADGPASALSGGRSSPASVGERVRVDGEGREDRQGEGGVQDRLLEHGHVVVLSADSPTTEPTAGSEAGERNFEARVARQGLLQHRPVDERGGSGHALGPMSAPVEPRDVHFAVIGDVHANFARLDRVLSRIARESIDAILLVGDIGSHDLSYARRRNPERDARYLASVEEVLRRAKTITERVLYVPGNHDLPDLAFEGNADHRVLEVSGVRIGGLGGAGPARFGFAYEWGEDDVRRRPELECDVLLVHAPPANTPLDRLARSPEHVGSVAIRERAERHRGVLVCGHIHEAGGVFRLNDCLCVNAGGLGAPYEADQVAFVARRAGTWNVKHEHLARGTASELTLDGFPP